MQIVRHILVGFAMLGVAILLAALITAWTHVFTITLPQDAISLQRPGFLYGWSPEVGGEYRRESRPYNAAELSQFTWKVYFHPPRLVYDGPVAGRHWIVYHIPYWLAFLCWEVPLALAYLLAWKADRKYVLRRRRLAAWRTSQQAFPVVPHAPPQPASPQQSARQP